MPKLQNNKIHNRTFSCRLPNNMILSFYDASQSVSLMTFCYSSFKPNFAHALLLLTNTQLITTKVCQYMEAVECILFMRKNDSLKIVTCDLLLLIKCLAFYVFHLRNLVFTIETVFFVQNLLMKNPTYACVCKHSFACQQLGYSINQPQSLT